MSILDWFDKREKKAVNSEKLNIPGNLWIKCPGCGEVIFKKDLEANMMVCMHCNHHFKVSADQRLAYVFDKDTFQELHANLEPTDILGFKDTLSYKERIAKAKKKGTAKEAVKVGEVCLKKRLVNVAIMDFSYMGGSMGSVVGEKITRIIEHSVETKRPLILFTMSGGARMQEGIVSLMQMAKTSAALQRLSAEKIPFIVVLCDPTTGGTSASYAMLGDIQIAEPGALISFAGPRVIEQTIKQKIPKGFQRSEFLLEHGMLDNVVDRKGLRDFLHTMLLALAPEEVTK